MHDILSSIVRVGIGSSAGILFGIILASVRFSLPGRIQSHPISIFLFEFMRFPPPIAWLPFVILLFGISPIGSVFVVFLATFPVVQTNVYEGLCLIPITIRRMTLSLELSKISKIRKIYIPMILPQVFSGVRLGVGMGWMSIIAAEMVSGQEGLGYSIQAHRVYLQHFEMLKDITFIGTIGFAIHFLLRKMEQAWLPWSQQQRVKKW